MISAVANASCTTNSTGGFPATSVWSQPLTLGEYDIWVDANKNGVFDEGDVWNNQSINIYSLDVIPENGKLLVAFLSVTLLIVMLWRGRGKNEAQKLEDVNLQTCI